MTVYYAELFGFREGGLKGRFLIGSLLLHVVLAAAIVIQLPSHLLRPAPPAPLTVTILDPDAIDTLPIGPTTQLPAKPRNPDPGPRSRPAPLPAPPVQSLQPATPKPLVSEMPQSPLRDDAPVASLKEPSEAVNQQKMAGSLDGVALLPQPAPDGALPPRLPFVSREELDQMARLFSEQPRPPDQPASVNTEDLLYLSYIANIARTLELVWQYPKAAGDLGQEGVTVLKVTILEDGTLEAAQLVKTSGHQMLDNEALRAIKRIAPYPPLPKSWQRSQWDLTISFTYSIHRVSVGVI